MIGSLGGPETAGVGWAAGIERLAMLLEEPAEAFPDIALVIEDDDLGGIGTWTTAELRRRNIAVEVVSSGSTKKRFDKALKLRPLAVLSLNAHLLQGESVANARLKLLAPLDGRVQFIANSIEQVFWSRYELNGRDWITGGDIGLTAKQQ